MGLCSVLDNVLMRLWHNTANDSWLVGRLEQVDAILNHIRSLGALATETLVFDSLHILLVRRDDTAGGNRDTTSKVVLIVNYICSRK